MANRPPPYPDNAFYNIKTGETILPFIEDRKSYQPFDGFSGPMLPLDNVNHPKHYLSGEAKCSKCGNNIECIDVIRHMNFNVGNAIKYLWRHEHKGSTIEDLKKAQWYITDEIKRLQKGEQT